MGHPVQSFDTWYERAYGPVLAGMTLFCLGEHATAEDCVNEAFVAALEKWERVSVMESPTGWVVQTATNSAKRTYRRRKRRLELLNSERLEVFSHDAERDMDLWAALERLSKRQREALVLRYVLDLAQGDVAKEMNVALGTATATLTQARGRLRDDMTKGDIDATR